MRVFTIRSERTLVQRIPHPQTSAPAAFEGDLPTAGGLFLLDSLRERSIITANDNLALRSGDHRVDQTAVDQR